MSSVRITNTDTSIATVTEVATSQRRIVIHDSDRDQLVFSAEPTVIRVVERGIQGGRGLTGPTGPTGPAAALAETYIAFGSALNEVTGNANLTFASDVLSVIGNVSVTTEAYGPAWESSTHVPTKGAIYAKIEALPIVSGGVAGYMPYYTGEDALASSGLFWDGNILDINGDVAVNTTININNTLLKSIISDVIETPNNLAFSSPSRLMMGANLYRVGINQYSRFETGKIGIGFFNDVNNGVVSVLAQRSAIPNGGAATTVVTFGEGPDGPNSIFTGYARMNASFLNNYSLVIRSYISNSRSPLALGQISGQSGNLLSFLDTSTGILSAFNYRGDLRLGGNTPTARLHITGEGTTSSTTALLVENSAGTDALQILDNTWAGFNTTPTTGVDVLLANPAYPNFNIRNSVGNILNTRYDGLIRLGSAGASFGPTNTLFNNFQVDQGTFGFISPSNWSTAGNNIGYWFYDRGSSATSGSLRELLFGGIGPSGFNPTSGTANYTFMSVQPRINQTGSASGYVAGIDYNPTLTSVLGAHYGLLIRSGKVGFGTATPTARLHITGEGTTNLTTALLVENSAGTDMVEIKDDGKVNFGAASGVGRINLPNAGTTSADGIFFGVDHVIYRQSANNLAINAGIQLNTLIAGQQRFSVSTSFSSFINSLSITPPTLTGSLETSAISISQTWNTTGNPTALLLNVTNTASGTTSKLMDLQVGATSRLTVLKDGNVGIGTASPAASALVDITSTTQGLLVPRMTTAQRDAIASPATGLQLYNTNLNSHNFYNGYQWKALDRTGSVITSTTTVTNTVTETTLWTGSISANELVSGNVYTLQAFGEITNATASDDIVFNVYVGSTLISTYAPAIGNVTDAPWETDLTFTQRTTGATGEIAIHGKVDINDSVDRTNTITTVDTTTAEDITIKVQWNNAKVGNTISIFQGYMSVKN